MLACLTRRPEYPRLEPPKTWSWYRQGLKQVFQQLHVNGDYAAIDGRVEVVALKSIGRTRQDSKSLMHGHLSHKPKNTVIHNLLPAAK